MSSVSAAKPSLDFLQEVLTNPEKYKPAVKELIDRETAARKAENSLSDTKAELERKNGALQSDLAAHQQREREFKIIQDKVAATQASFADTQDKLGQREASVVDSEASLTRRTSEFDSHYKVKSAELTEREALVTSKEKRLADKEAELLARESEVQKVSEFMAARKIS